MGTLVGRGCWKGAGGEIFSLVSLCLRQLRNPREPLLTVPFQMAFL